MRYISSTLYLLVCLAYTAAAQPRFTSHTEQHNFGQIVWKRPVSVQYVVTNTGNQQLLLTDVEPDCACTVAQWTRTPIAPNGRGVIEVTFDAKTLGHFQKSVAVRTNAQTAPVYLTLSGEVVQEIKDYTQTHPYLIGQIRIDKQSLDFPDVQCGEKPVMEIGVVNLSPQAYEPVLMHLPTYLQATVTPRVLKTGEKGVITLTLDSEKLTDLGLTQASVYLARFSGDKVGEENELPLSVVMLPDFSAMSAGERANAPAISLSATNLDMTALLAKKAKAHQDIFITNSGHSPLRISKLQVFHRAIGVSLRQSVLQPGEQTRLRVTLTKKNIGKRHRRLRLLMITNDPAQPKVEINIKH